MPNNLYERDFNDLGALKRPGRLDFKTLNNVDDAGDGHPGMQKAIRNYFHEGYLEKDINMNTHKIINLQAPTSNNDGARKVDVDTVQNDLDDFDDELKSLSSVEVQQLQNIGSVTISNAQWGYLGVLDQSLAQSQSPTFVGLTLSAGLVTTSTIDGVNLATFKSSYDSHNHDDIYYTETEIDANTYTRAQVDAHNWTEGDITDLDKYTQAEVDALKWVEADITDLDKYTQAQVDAFKLNKWVAPDGDVAMGAQKITGCADPIDDQDVATKNFVKNYLPIGTILMYKGTGWVDNSTILGWWKCDGANGTPDLVDKFIRSESSSSNEGGSDDVVVVQHNHGASAVAVGEHTHDIRCMNGAGGYRRILADVELGAFVQEAVSVPAGGHGHAITVNNEGVSGVGANKPVYYSLIFIMRVS